MRKTTLRTASAIIFLLACCPAAFAQATGDGIWIRSAFFGEAQTFDRCLGHQPGQGQYHHHVHPICLRAQLDDNLVTVGTGRTGTQYREKAAPWRHSPILGWSFDGYPIYGPYGYTEAMNANSAVKRITSGFRLRNITQRTSLPDWALAHHPNIPQTLAANQYGPDVSETFPLGRYYEDFDFSPSFGDLDHYNGRMTVTPEYPNGTYAYFVTINDDGSPAFPYTIGIQYYGTAPANQGPGQPPPANAQTYFANGSYTQPLNTAPQLNTWFTRNSLQEARVVSGFDPAAGPKTTWPVDVPTGARTSGGVDTPEKADPQTISFTDSTVYVSSNNLASYVMGPWFAGGGNGGVFNNFPSVINTRAQIPRVPSVAATKRNSGAGPVGIWVNGVAVFNAGNGATYSNAARNDAGGGPVQLSSVHVSSASFEGGPTSPGAMMTAFPLFGAKLATATANTQTVVWPASLAGAMVSVRDAAGVTHAAGIGYASPFQLNYRVPENAAEGLATVTINAGGVSVPGAINIVSAYPNLFSLNGENLAAAVILRIRDGQAIYENIFQIVNNALVAAPIDFGPPNDQLYLVLFGTGLGKSNVTAAAKVGGVDLPVAYAGVQGSIPGLDQFNIALPRTLTGKGKIDLTVTVNGKISNAVSLTFK